MNVNSFIHATVFCSLNNWQQQSFLYKRHKTLLNASGKNISLFVSQSFLCSVHRQELHIASLQQEPNSMDLQVLLVRRASDGLARPVGAHRLDESLAKMNSTLGLSIHRVRQHSCVEHGCPGRSCRSSVLMSEERMNHYSTARASFITPRHSWENVCSCNGRRLPFKYWQTFRRGLAEIQEPLVSLFHII